MLLHLAFLYSHNIKVVNKKIPSDADWISSKHFFVSHPFRSRHIGHFTESVNHALLKLRYPLQYYPFTDLYFPEYPLEKHEWAKMYLKLLLDLFPEQYRPKVHLPGSLNIKKLTCFKSAVCNHIYYLQFRFY